MIKELIVLIRGFRKNKLYAFINISGLSIAIACGLVLATYVSNELTYDRFHENADQILRIYSHATLDQEYSGSKTPGPLAPALAEDIPEIVNATRFYYSDVGTKTLVRVNEETMFYESNLIFADSSFLDIFSFILSQGNPRTALKQPYSILLTEEMSQKYFGSEDAIGKILTLGGKDDYKITGILENTPQNSHIRFDFVASYSSLQQWQDLKKWLGHMVYSYVEIKPGASVAEVEAEIPAFLKRRLGESRREEIDYRLQPLSQIHLHSSHILGFYQPQSDIIYVYVFSAVGIFILIIACINFMNLTTARSATRAKEIGMRKVLGASRLQIIKQFLAESTVSALIALLLAVILIVAIVPIIPGIPIVPSDLLTSPWVWLIAVSSTVTLGMVSGSYPAFLLSRFRSVSVLGGRLDSGKEGALLRKLLVILQFTCATVLILGTMVIFKQVNFARDKNLGFNQKQLLAIPKVEATTLARDDLFKNLLTENSNISDVSSCLAIPGRSFTMPKYGYRAEGQQQEQGLALQTLFVDYDYIETMGLEVVAGRGFSRGNLADIDNRFIINQAAAKHLGWSDPVGRLLEWQVATGAKGATTWKRGPVIGVIKDFHANSLHEAIAPMVLHVWPDWHGFYLLRLNASNVSASLAHIQEKWTQFFSGVPPDYFFVDENFNELYKFESGQGDLIGFFALLSIAISCLGLFGMTSYTAERKTKEIGIRKVLGATVAGIASNLSKELLALIIISCAIAWPVGYFIMSQWLQNFAYRIAIRPEIFLISGACVLVISLITISFQTMRAALSNPVKTLKYE